MNQSEDAVALGYRVLEKTVEEIKKGYKEAQAFNRKQEEFEKAASRSRGGRRAPAGPADNPLGDRWSTRVQSLQDIALEAVRDGTDIFFDSIKSGMKSTRSVAKTWEQSREDVDANPVLAGPGVRGSRSVSHGARGPGARTGRWADSPSRAGAAQDPRGSRTRRSRSFSGLEHGGARAAKARSAAR